MVSAHPTLMTQSTEPHNLVSCSMLRKPVLEAEGLRWGRKLQTLTFRNKRRLPQECIEEAVINQLPGVSDGTGARKRTGR
jgi:hypothetical protein